MIVVSRTGQNYKAPQYLLLQWHYGLWGDLKWRSKLNTNYCYHQNTYTSHEDKRGTKIYMCRMLRFSKGSSCIFWFYVLWKFTHGNKYNETIKRKKKSSRSDHKGTHISFLLLWHYKSGFAPTSLNILDCLNNLMLILNTFWRIVFISLSMA